MKYATLGTKNKIKVSKLCLGTMTWGEQNTEKEAHAQLDYAFERGINFLDTAEMYPIPPKKKTCTFTESIIGRWDKMKTRREEIVVATKIAGPGLEHIRGGSSFSRAHMTKALDSSLKRLNTDTIDLYQLHWPEREVNVFGTLGLTRLAPRETFTPFLNILECLQELTSSGKIREFGLSNETPWGTMKFLETAKEFGLPRPTSVQNPYNLLNRSYEVGMSEISLRENCKLLAYSPLGFGVLTGKYLNEQRPKGARLTLFPHYTRYTGLKSQEAAKMYVTLAQKEGLLPSHMALSFITSKSFVLSNIIGATSLQQLQENIDSIELSLRPQVEDQIEQIHEMISNPAP